MLAPVGEDVGMEPWILFTLLAALMQSVRTAGQKKLALALSPMATTLVRYLFGLPFALLYLGILLAGSTATPVLGRLFNPEFLIYATLASIAQIAATVWLVRVLSLRNFAVGIVLSKTEAMQVAVLGLVFFGATLTALGWLAIFIGALGVLLLSLPGAGQRADFHSVGLGLLSGIGFAFTALWLRQASLSLDGSHVQNAGLTLAYTVTLQSLICVIVVGLKEVRQFAVIGKQLSLCWFVGATSCLGSVGWYTAMSYQNAALVRSLGQVELIFAAVITYLFFGERISIREFAGMAAIALSVVLLLLLG
jgi:drug/metabolite transporter (DMT)-like permease